LGGEKLKSIRTAIYAAIVAVTVVTGILTTGVSAQEVSGEAEALLQVLPDTVSAEFSGESTAPAAPEDFLIPWDNPPETADGNGSSLFIVIRMVLVLGLAAAAIYGVVFFIKKASRPPEQRNPNLKILTSASLGANRFVYVVSVGTKAWLLGAGDGGGVSLISEVTDQEAIDAMLLEDSRKAAESSSRFQDFRALLRRLGGKPPVSGGFSVNNAGFAPGPENQGFSASGGGVSAAGLRKRRERLKGL
jgi:flagellar protein FliO/FliZ